jgi:hypothetical protein
MERKKQKSVTETLEKLFEPENRNRMWKEGKGGKAE